MRFASRRTTKAQKAKVEALARSGDVAGLIEPAGQAEPWIRAATTSSLAEIGPGAMVRGDATYYTISDAEFFLGTVMLLNSLRLTGNEGKLVVLDAGLDPGQRTLLEGHADVVDIPKKIAGTPVSMSPYPYLVGASGTVVLIDSDIVVTGRLDEALDLACEGRIVAAPAWTEAARNRWFAEWEATLKLRAPLRREDWFHAGFVVLEVGRWPNLLERWWELNELVPPEQAFLWHLNQPFNASDADSLNALLMSEIPRSALALLPEGAEAFGGHVTIEDVESLRCTLNGIPTRLLHYPDSPKPWQRRGWVRAGATAYAKIMRRLLFEPDVPLRLDPADVPVWLRPSLWGRVALRPRAAANSTIGWLSRRLPETVRDRLRKWRREAVGRRKHVASVSTTR
jgi:hypothetical protein